MAWRLLIVVVAALSTGGCVPVLVGGLIYKSTKTQEERAGFTSQFQRTNLEREKAGLARLDWCSETYKFDKGWAVEDPVCADRVKRYEQGEKTALSQ